MTKEQYKTDFDYKYNECIKSTLLLQNEVNALLSTPDVKVKFMANYTETDYKMYLNIAKKIKREEKFLELMSTIDFLLNQTNKTMKEALMNIIEIDNIASILSKNLEPFSIKTLDDAAKTINRLNNKNLFEVKKEIFNAIDNK